MLIKIHELLLKYNLKIKGILHIGASMCEELIDYLQIGIPIQNIIWIEANEDICNQMKKNDKIRIFNATISDKDNQEVELIITNNLQSSSILELEEHKKEHPHVWETSRKKVLTKTIKSLYAENNLNSKDYNFVNIDIQGAELLALKGMGDILKDVDYLYLEVNTKYLYKNCALVDEVDKYLSNYNFKRIETKMTQHGWGDAFYSKKF